MDGWAETYYRTEEDYELRKNKVLPYAVNCKVKDNIGKLTTRLREEGYTYAETFAGIPSQMTSFLVNTEFRKYTKIPYPVKFECVNDKVYSIEEFIEMVFAKN